jgi:hypothetical protein
MYSPLSPHELFWGELHPNYAYVSELAFPHQISVFYLPCLKGV